MIESFNFTYKKTNMFHHIQPAGLSVYGERGVDGKDGVSGSTLYFVNYDIITETIKANLISNIINSKNLNGTSSAIREYHNNDLIICEVAESIYNNVYKIVIKDNTYDIEKIGYISVNTNVVNIFNSIHSLSIGKGDYETTTCHVPVNRSFETSNMSDIKYKDGSGETTIGKSLHVTSYTNALRLLFGFSVKPIIKISDSDNANNYDFYLKIYVKNTKSILGRNNLPIRKGYTNITTSSGTIYTEPVTSNQNINIVKFEKVIEIPITKYYYNGTTNDLIGKDYNPVFFSDMGCDKLHPSLNNYSTSFFDPLRNYGYLTQLRDSNKYPFHAYYFDYGTSYSIKGQNIISDRHDSSIFKSIINKSESSYVTSFNDLLQYSKNPIVPSGETYCQVNFRSGESAYFSGMILNKKFTSDCFNTSSAYTKSIGSLANNTFDMYVAAQRSLNIHINEVGDTSPQNTFISNRIHSVRDYVCDEMYNFIFNSNNVFELICIDNRTGRTKTKIYSLDQIL